ncbi:MAG: diadenylate cyclase CdaA [Bacteroidetes bacterium]|nr:diadenylate cyclase CdaA [Bacteroidota bacterium]
MRETLFTIWLIPVTWIDLLDIAAVTIIFYRAYLVIQGTTASRMLMGLILILLVSIAVQLLNMSGMIWLVDQIRTVWVIAFVIIFQPELRRLLTFFGQSAMLRHIIKMGIPDYIEEIIRTCGILSKRRSGAIIVIERSTGLRHVIETGVKIEAIVSQPLLLSLFNPRSPLHDGAVILEGDQISAAKCLLPLSQNPYIESSLGTRHRAALGLSEQSDAIVIVISEESGAISIAHKGTLHRKISPAELRRFMSDILMMSKTKGLWRQFKKS